MVSSPAFDYTVLERFLRYVVIDTIGSALHKVVSDKDLQEHFLKVGLEATPMTPDELAKELDALEKTYAPIIKQLNIKLD
ncbi:MAG: hypothetical protein JSR61_01805 [Proteobacteria bacterium]|nr:hypothetical protein [Pseudomonadota bacterium]